SFRRAGNLDQQVRPRRARVQLSGGGECARRVVGQQRRHFQRYPSVHAVRLVPDRSKQIGRARQILERQLEEQGFARLPLPHLLLDGGVVRLAVLDRVVEDRRVGGQPRHRELVDVTRERTVLQQVPSDVVEPETLALVVERRRGFHTVISRDMVKGREGWAVATSVN